MRPECPGLSCREVKIGELKINIQTTNIGLYALFYNNHAHYVRALSLENCWMRPACLVLSKSKGWWVWNSYTNHQYWPICTFLQKPFNPTTLPCILSSFLLRFCANRTRNCSLTTPWPLLLTMWKSWSFILRVIQGVLVLCGQFKPCHSDPSGRHLNESG